MAFVEASHYVLFLQTKVLPRRVWFSCSLLWRGWYSRLGTSDNRWVNPESCYCVLLVDLSKSPHSYKRLPRKKKMHFIWVLMYLARKCYFGTLFLRLLVETGPPFYVLVPVTRSFLSHFKTLSVGTVPEIKPVTSRSPVKRSTDWANPATNSWRQSQLELVGHKGDLLRSLTKAFSETSSV